MNKALGYQNVALVPRYSILRSRSEADVSVEFLGRRLAGCWLPSNMESVINVDIARWLSENQFAYIYHRFGDTYDFVDRANKEGWKLISISVGVKDVDKGLLRAIVEKGLRVDWITIDVAMGHHVLVKEMIQFIKGLNFSVSQTESMGPDYSGHPISFSTGYQYTPKIIAGNVTTPEAVRDLTEWGADCVKCGIAGGSACHTKQKTGFHVPMFSCVRDCVSETHDLVSRQRFANYKVKEDYPDYEGVDPIAIPIIADGGVRENGDIAKSIVAGATLTMIGGMVAACTDAPGENVYDGLVSTNPGVPMPPIARKKFHGSASSRQKGKKLHVEGVELEIPCNGMTVAELYQDIRESLQSACSYAGATNLAGLKDVKYVEVK